MFGSKSLKIKSAVKGHSKFDLSSHHLTTLDFGQIVPIFVQHEVIPGDSFSVKESLFSRVAPMPVPTYGNCWLKTATFFVPYHQVAQDVESWLAGDKYFNGELTQARTIPYSCLIGIFVEISPLAPASSSFAANTALCNQVSASTHYDFSIIKSAAETIYYQFTSLGRYYYKVLRSLGYGFAECMDATKHTADIWDVKINILPLLSYFKAYNDWMSQSALYNRSQLSSILSKYRYNFGSISVGQHSGYLSTMFSSVLLQYESNYFTTAWQAPNEVISGQGYNDSSYNPNSGLDKTIIDSPNQSLSYHLGLSTDSTSTSISNAYGSSNANLNTISANALKFLNAFDSWLRRNNYSGARSVEKLLSRFGVKTEDYRNEFAILLDTSKCILNVGDVTNQTDTGNQNQPLGSYAGKGIVSGDNSFKFKSSDFGTIITFAWIQPDVQYYEGWDRTVLKYSVSDFYQPEYDSLQAMPISMFELAQDPKRAIYDRDHRVGTRVFGFTERYAELKNPRNRVTGDFAIYENYNSWHYGRSLTNSEDEINITAQSAEIMSHPQVGSQYDRIFTDDTDTQDYGVDHFYLTCYFDVNADRPMLNTSEVANLGDGNLNIQRNGTQMS